MIEELALPLADEAATLALGARLATLRAPLLVRLRGDLGAGKTTLVRGWLRALGHRGAVKSPTYTLVEPYDTPSTRVYHFDLYRLGEADELDAIGFRDYLGEGAICLVEWPERAEAALAAADLEIGLDPAGEGRLARLSACSPGAVAWLAQAFAACRSGPPLA